jgi:hypothetical protein
MEKCPICQMFVTPLKMNKHRSACDGQEPSYMRSRPGRVKSSTLRSTGTEIRRTVSSEAHHILSSNVPASVKLERMKRDLPYLKGKPRFGTIQTLDDSSDLGSKKKSGRGV